MTIPAETTPGGGIAVTGNALATASVRDTQLQSAFTTSMLGGDGGGATGIDLQYYWRLILKRYKIILGIIGFCLAATLIGTLLKTPIYRGTASIQIERNAIQVVKPDGLSNEGSNDAEFYQTQYELLQTRSLAERVVTNLKLAESDQFLRPPSSGLFQRLRQMFSNKADQQPAALDLIARKRAATGKLLANLVIDPLRGSRIVRIHFSDPDRQIAQLVANGVAENFISEVLDRRYDATSYARTFLEERLKEMKSKLEDSEKEVVAYASREQIISADDKQSLPGVNLSAINTALTAAKTERLKLEQTWALAQTNNIYGLPQILENKSVQSNRDRRTELSAQYQQKLMLFKPSYPEMVQLKAQIDDLDQQVLRIVTVVKSSIRSQLESAKSSEAELEKRLEDQKAMTIAFRERSIQYNILQREVDTNRSLYDGLLQRYKEIGVGGGLGVNNISIVDRAETPGSPYTPRMDLNLSVALAGGLLLGLATALLLEHADNTVRSPEDIENNLKLPVLGVIPLVEDGKHIDEELEDQRSHISESYRSLVTTLQFSTSRGIPRTLAVTSASPSEGKSTTSMTLACSLARVGTRVLLIDADLRKASLHSRLNLSNSFGLSNYLSGTMQPEQIVQETPRKNLFFISSGPLPPNPAELLAGPKFSSFLTLAQDFFDVVIIDAPPMLGLADAPLIGSVVEGTLLVISAGVTRQDVAQVAIKRLQMSRSHVLGAVLNKFHAKHAGYGYGYGYGYGATYGDGPTADESEKIEAPIPAAFPAKLKTGS